MVLKMEELGIKGPRFHVDADAGCTKKKKKKFCSRTFTRNTILKTL